MSRYRKELGLVTCDQKGWKEKNNFICDTLFFPFPICDALQWAEAVRNNDSTDYFQRADEV